MTWVCVGVWSVIYAVWLGSQLHRWHYQDMKPQDIALKPYNRRPSDAWSNVGFRATVVTFIEDFVAARGWVESWDITERFTSTNPGTSARSIDVRVQRGPSQLFDNTPAEEFKQRPGVRLLVFGVTRIAKAAFGGRKRFECSVHFEQGILTPPPTLNVLLTRVAQSLDAAYRKDRGL